MAHQVDDLLLVLADGQSHWDWDTAQTLFGGSSEESWTMGASLIQLFRVGDEGYFDRKTLS